MLSCLRKKTRPLQAKLSIYNSTYCTLLCTVASAVHSLSVVCVCVCVYSVYSVIVASWVFFPIWRSLFIFYLEYNGDIPFSMRRGFLSTYSHNNTAANITGPLSCDTKVPYHLRKKTMLHLPVGIEAFII